MSPPLGLLYNRKMLGAVALFCLIAAVWSWVSVTKGTRQHQDLVVVPFLLCLAFIAVSIVYRTSFWADRLVFGAIAGALALDGARVASSTLAAMLVIDLADALMWTIAAFISLIVLARGFRASTMK
jgi:hypothetical protein